MTDTRIVKPLSHNVSKAKLIFAVATVNCLDFFSSILYGLFVVYIVHSYSPLSNSILFMVFTAYAVIFYPIIKPIGGAIIGIYADIYGRKKAMLIPISLMAIGSAFIGFSPSAIEVGIFSLFLIHFGRILQILAIGGQFTVATTLLMESATPKKRGFFISWHFMSEAFGMFIATLLAFYFIKNVDNNLLMDGGWKIPFIVSVVFSLLIIAFWLYVRSSIEETYSGNKHDQIKENPLYILIKKHLGKVLICILMMMSVGLLNDSFYFFRSRISADWVFVFSIYLSVIVIVFALIAGFLCDRFMCRKSIILIMLVVSFASLFLFLYFPTISILSIILYMVIFGCLTVSVLNTTMLVLESFDKSIRATAIGVICATAVLLYTILKQQLIIILGLYFALKGIDIKIFLFLLILFISFIGVCFFNEKKHKIVSFH